MNQNILYTTAFLLAQCFFSPFSQAYEISHAQNAIEHQELPFVEKSLNYDPTPYLLPANHPLKPILDSLFPTQEVIKDAKSLAKAGFITLKEKKSSGIRLITHKKLPGYLIKLYLLSQTMHRSDMSKQNWLIQRCRGAAKIRNLIQTKHLCYFTVPDKWLYELPKRLGERKKRTFVVVETYMNLVSEKDTERAWKKEITKNHLREFLLFTKIGGTSGSGGLLINTPYTKEGKFAFIDTEYPDRIFPPSTLKKMGRYFSPTMRKYWIHLVNTKCKK